MAKVEMPRLGDLLEKAVDSTVTEVLAGIERRAKETAPVDTGFFRNNIKADYYADEVVANANYSAALEYGVANTRRAPRPTMRNAARAMAGRVGEIFRRSFK